MMISVILTTYNSPAWLEKVLWGYSAQTHQDFEIIIADDGSTIETKNLVEIFKQETSLNIKHVWQKDKGFRKCRILNKAIVEMSYDYAVFSDGDCIPRKDFLAVHAEEAQRGYYLSGGYNKLPMSTSLAITKDDIVSGRCFQLKWLRQQGLQRSIKDSKLLTGTAGAKILNRFTTTSCNFKGSNGSAWRDNILAVNGFDERMPWGGLDREFGVRLINYGIKPKHVRYNAIVIHLDHQRSYKNPETVRANKLFRRQVEKEGRTSTTHGIKQLYS